MIKLSIIIVNYHTNDLITKLRNSISAQRPPFEYEIIVEDNTHRNIGFGPANNLGARQAVGEYLFFLNPDTILEQKNSLELLVKYLNDHPKVGVLGPKLIDSEDVVQWSADHAPTLMQMVLDKPLALIHKTFPKNQLVWKILGVFSRKYATTRETTQIDWVSGAALLTRKALFDQIGGFDDQIFMYFDDVDYCLRIKQHGYAICYLPTVKIKHLIGRSLQPNQTRDDFYYQSQQYFFAKHGSRIDRLLLPTLVKLYRHSKIKQITNRYY